MKEDYYKILGVSKGASASEIKKAYRIHLKDFIFHIVIDLKTYIICVFSSVCRAMFQLSRLVVQASSETELLKKEL